MLAEVVQRHLLRDGRDLVEADLAPEPLDVELLRVPEAAEGLERRVAGVEPGFRRQQLRRVGLAAARPAVIEEPGGLQAHDLGRVELGGGMRQWMGDGLVPADGPVEDDALLRVLDGAVERGTAEQGLMAYTLGADGSGADLLCKQMGGSLIPPSHEAIDKGLHLLIMDGKGVFKWATRVLCDSIVEVLDHARLELSDIDLFVLHQANMRIIDAAADYLGIDRQKLVVNIERYGNTSGGSVPLALDEACRQGRVRGGDKILMSGYGAGLSWGTAIFRW